MTPHVRPHVPAHVPAHVATSLGDFRISAVIMTHPARPGLAAAIQRAEPRLSFHSVVDERPEASPDGALATALRAWRSVAPGATHHLVLQDDVTPCPGFAARLQQAITCDTDRAFSMFSEWGSKTAQVIRMAALTGCGWAGVADPFLPAPAVLMPAPVAREFGEFLAERISAGERRDAFLMLHYLTAVGRRPLVCVPNLVQHDDPVLVSLLPNGKVRGPRKTACYAGLVPPPAQWPTDIRDAPAHLPYHSPHDLVASVCFDHDPELTWRCEPAFAWLDRHGWSLSDIDGRFRESMKRTPMPVDDHPLGYDSLRESWLGALVTGWVVADEGADLAIDPLALTPLQRAALRTMAAGPFRRVLSTRNLDYLERHMPEVLAHAVAQGAADVRAQAAVA